MLLRILVSALLCMLLAVPASAADRIFVTFPGASFVGDSTDPAHVDWIDAYALAGGVASPGGAAPSFDEVTFLKGPDRATHKLFELNRNVALPQAVIEVCRDTATTQCYFRMTLDTVFVTQAQVSESTCLDPSVCNPSMTESVALSFTKITWSYSAFDAKGGTTGTNSGCWDLAKNVSCGFTNGIP